MNYHKPRRFYLERTEDVSGVSGTGVVAHGVEFVNGLCVLSFLSPFVHANVYVNLRTLEEVHSHEGRTRVVFIDKENES
jgi:hypothetical protein